jgi:putative transposase
MSDHDREAYLETLVEFRLALDLKVYAYCLMTNHVHLIVDPGDNAASISHLMKRLAGRHTRRLNRLHGRTGTAWQGRFRCSPIDSDRYLLACSRYIDLNPVRANMVSSPADFGWSSYRTKVGLTNCEWLDLDPCYLSLGSSAQCRQLRYRELVAGGTEDDELTFLRNAVRRNQLTGSSQFIRDVERLSGVHVPHRGRGRPSAAQ